MNRKYTHAWLLLLLMSAAALSFLFLNKRPAKLPDFSKLRIYFPFKPSKILDPRIVHTVGDQVVVEHTFAYLRQSSFKYGMMDVFAETKIDHKNNEIRVSLIHDGADSAGKNISGDYLCRSLTSSFKGTYHVHIQTSLKKLWCKEKSAILEMNKIPINILDTLTAPGFSIYNPDELPAKPGTKSSYTGPYWLKERTPNLDILKINNMYPKQLRANNIDTVEVHWKITSEPKFLNNLDPAKTHLFYMMGFLAPAKFRETIETSGYNVEEYPSEWLLHLGFGEQTSIEDRIILGNIIDSARDELSKSISPGQTAYSISPKDGGFGFDRVAYKKNKTMYGLTKSKQNSWPSKQINLAIYSFYSESVFQKSVINALKNALGEKIKIHVVDVKSGKRLSSPEFDAYLAVIGITPGEPLGHFSFLQNTSFHFKNSFSDKELEQASFHSKTKDFVDSIRELEGRVLSKRLMVPIAHFPGIVASSKHLSKDERLSWGWGIQAWTYRLVD